MERKDLFDVVIVRGADALPFLHGQLAADLMSLSDGQLRWSALLNPQGRVLFVVAALRLSHDEWRLIVPFSRGLELTEHLRRLVFRRKVVLSVDPALRVIRQASGYDTGIPDLRLALASSDAAGELVTDAALDRFLAAGLALVDRNASGRFLAHALRLDRFDAFSVKKGCYPGQEIVARTHFLGRNKRVLAQLEDRQGAQWRSADILRSEEAVVGEIACAGDELALAVLTQPVAAGQCLEVGNDRAPVRVTGSDVPES
jgi:hypothetical protein